MVARGWREQPARACTSKCVWHGRAHGIAEGVALKDPAVEVADGDIERHPRDNCGGSPNSRRRRRARLLLRLRLQPSRRGSWHGWVHPLWRAYWRARLGDFAIVCVRQQRALLGLLDKLSVRGRSVRRQGLPHRERQVLLQMRRVAGGTERPSRDLAWAGSPPSLPPDLTIARSRSPHQFVNGNLIDEACQQSKKQASRGPRGRAARLTQKNRGAVREVDRRHKKTVNLFCFTQILGAKFAMLRQTFIPHWHNEIAHSVISQVFNAHNPLICARTFTATCVALRTLRHSQHVPLPRLPRCRERGEFSRIPSATQSIHPSAGDAHLCTLVHRLSSRRPRRTPS